MRKLDLVYISETETHNNQLGHVQFTACGLYCQYRLLMKDIGLTQVCKGILEFVYEFY